MNNFYLGLIILAIIVVVIIFIWVMLELRKAIRALKELVTTTENSLKPTLAELQETLKSLRNVADNVHRINAIHISSAPVGAHLKKVHYWLQKWK